MKINSLKSIKSQKKGTSGCESATTSISQRSNWQVCNVNHDLYDDNSETPSTQSSRLRFEILLSRHHSLVSENKLCVVVMQLAEAPP